MTSYILDTHAFLWFDHEPNKLSPTVATICQDPQNALYLSIASIWEIQIKVQTGKLILPLPLQVMVYNQLQKNRLRILPITLPQIYDLANLPPIHRDPFDRLLITQTRIKGLTLITADAIFSHYSVTVIW